MYRANDSFSVKHCKILFSIIALYFIVKIGFSEHYQIPMRRCFFFEKFGGENVLVFCINIFVLTRCFFGLLEKFRRGFAYIETSQRRSLRAGFISACYIFFNNLFLYSQYILYLKSNKSISGINSI